MMMFRPVGLGVVSPFNPLKFVEKLRNSHATPSHAALEMRNFLRNGAAKRVKFVTARAYLKIAQKCRMRFKFELIQTLVEMQLLSNAGQVLYIFSAKKAVAKLHVLLHFSCILDIALQTCFHMLLS